MKKYFVFLMLFVLLVTVIPASADRRELVGERLDIYTGDAQDFPAGVPFHIKHGWIGDPSLNEDIPKGRHDFVLELDGVIRPEDFLLVTADPQGGNLYWFGFDWVHNFPVGMTGQHTFTGHWFGPCQLYSDNCPTPNEKIEVYTNTVVVTFIP